LDVTVVQFTFMIKELSSHVFFCVMCCRAS